MNIVERLKDSLEYEYNLSFSERKKLLEEIDRLNNIINELEKDIRNNMAEYDKLYEELDEQEYIDKYFALKVELDKLKELKEE